MNELRVDIGGSNRGFQIASDDTKRIARDLQRSLEQYTPQTWRGNMAAKDKYGPLFNASKEGGGMLQRLSGLLGENGNAITELAGKYGRAAGIIGAFSFAAKQAYDALKAAFNLQREASNLGVSVGFFKTFGRAAEEAGIEAEEAQEKLYRVTAQIGAAASGTDKAARDLFAGMGVKIGGQTMEQVLLQVARAFEDMTDPAEKARKSVELFGRGGQAVLPVLRELAELNGHGGLASQALREGWNKSMLANMISVDDEEVAIEAKAYQAIKRGVAAPFRWLKGAWNHALASVASGVFGVTADAPTQARITEQESPEEIAAIAREAEKAAQEQAQERTRLEKEYHEELEQTVSLTNRIALLREDMARADTERYAAQRAGDYNAYLAAQVELLKKRKEFDEAAKQLTTQQRENLVKKEIPEHIDSLASMGGFASAASIQNQTLDVQRKALEKLDTIARNTAPRKSIYDP